MKNLRGQDLIYLKRRPLELAAGSTSGLGSPSTMKPTEPYVPAAHS